MDLQQILEHAVRLYADRTAVACGATRMTYRSLAERVHRLCQALHGLGIAKGDRLAILMYNCHRYFELYYVTPEMGTLAVPLNIRLAGSEIAYILNDSGSNTLFIGSEFLPLLAEIRDQLPALRHCIFAGDGPPPEGVHSYEQLLAAASADFPAPRVTPEDLAALFYTSGTTGHPAILEAAVVGVPDATWGEAIKAIVVLKPGVQASAEDIMAHCRMHIAHFKVPRSVDFYAGALPKSGSGKILKRELREKYWVGQERMVH